MRGFLEFTAGAAIGLLVGFIAGLSISPVVATILGTLSTGLLILLGFKEPRDGMASTAHSIRVLGFGLSCLVALITGILFRTHAVLSPPLAEQKSRLTAVNVFTPPEVEQILLLTNYGLQAPSSVPPPPALAGPEERKSGQDQQSMRSGEENKEKPTNFASAQPQPALASLASAGLLRAGPVEFCQSARRESFNSVGEYVTEVRRWDPKLAQFIESLPPVSRDQASRSLSRLLCP